MIIVRRTHETRVLYNAQTQQRQTVAIVQRTYICDLPDCPSAEEEGHAPEDNDMLPRGWAYRYDAGEPRDSRPLLCCPLHDDAAMAGKPIELRRAADIIAVRELPVNGKEHA